MDPVEHPEYKYVEICQRSLCDFKKCSSSLFSNTLMLPFFLFESVVRSVVRSKTLNCKCF